MALTVIIALIGFAVLIFGDMFQAVVILWVALATLYSWLDGNVKGYHDAKEEIKNVSGEYCKRPKGP